MVYSINKVKDLVEFIGSRTSNGRISNYDEIITEINIAVDESNDIISFTEGKKLLPIEIEDESELEIDIYEKDLSEFGQIPGEAVRKIFVNYIANIVISQMLIDVGDEENQAQIYINKAARYRDRFIKNLVITEEGGLVQKKIFRTPEHDEIANLISQFEEDGIL